MASSKFSESPIREEEYAEVEENLTVVVADSPDLAFDEEAVENLIESSGSSKSVTFIRMESSGTISEPIIMDIMPSDELLDGTEIIELLTDSFIDSDPSQIDQPSEISTKDNDTTSLDSTIDSPSKRGPPKRRSQRQIDREMQEEANRIKKENQETFKKEREALQKRQNVSSTPVAEPKVPDSDPTVEETNSNSEVSESTPSQTTIRGRKAKVIAEAETTVEISPSRPKRQRKLPAHLQSSDFEFSLASVLRVDPEVKETKRKSQVKVEEPPASTDEVQPVIVEILKEEEKKDDIVKVEVDEADEAEDAEEKEESGASDADWDSEDDPERLWCICNKPHNNKFMICCDVCKDWFHGQCVGITKKMGQDLEEAQATWTCPSCEKNYVVSVTVDGHEVSIDRSSESTTKKPQLLQGKRKKDFEVNEKKPKERTCIECEKPAFQSSAYCSDECVVKHVIKAKDRFKRVRMSSNLKALAQGQSKVDSAKDHLVVVESFTNNVLSGKTAPTEANLEEWLKAHSSYYVVLPSEVSTKMFYGSKPSPTKLAKFTTPHHETSKEEKLAQYNAAKNSALNSLQAKKKLLEESGETSSKREGVKRTNSAEKDTSKRIRRSSESASHARHAKEMTSPSSTPRSKPDQKPIRENARKGIREALKLKVSKTKDIKIKNEDLDKLSEVIEEEMFNLYRRDIGTKYKNKYRSLVFNIRDEKNNGLFRKIINGTFLPRQLVRMTADQMASKELQEWREAELRNDIEKIKSYELDMIALGSQFVMKSHKGEQLIEKDELIDSTVKTPAEVKLPEDMLPKNDGSGEKSKIGEKTWDHGNHPFLSTCDVCTGKMSLNDFVVAKMERAKKLEEERRRRAKRSRSRDRHRSHGKSKHSSRSKDERKHRSRSRDRHSSKDKKRSNNDEKEQKEKANNESSADANKSHHSTPSEGKDHHPSKDHHGSSKSSKESHSSVSKSSRHSSSKSSKDGQGSSSSRTKDRHSTGSSSKEHHKSGSKERHSSTSSSSKHHHHRSSSHHKSSSSSKHKSSSKSNQPTDEKTFKKSSEEPKIELERPKTPDIEKPQEITCEAIQKALNVIQESLSQKVPEVCEDTGEVLLPVDDDTDLVLTPEMETTETDKKPERVDPDDPYDPSVDISEDMVESPKEDKLSGPESSRSDPSVWRGSLTMEEVSKLSVPLKAYKASGICDFLEEDFREHLRICGRIQPDTVWEYLGKISENPSKEILVVQFETTGGSHQSSYKDLFNYFKQRNRFGVIDLENRGSMLKDFYIIPLGAKEQLHPCVPFEGPGISNDESDVLVGLVIRNRRRRTGDASKPKPSASYSSGMAKSKPKPISTPSLSYIPTPQTSDQAPYDPATMTFADDLDSVSSDGDEAYDPDSAFPAYNKNPEENHANKAVEKQSPNGSDSNDSESPLPGLGDLPKGIANILFRSDPHTDSSDKLRDPRKRTTDTSAPISSVSSTLRSISDAELMAIAARQTEDDSFHNISDPFNPQTNSHGSKSSGSQSVDYNSPKSHSRQDSWKDGPDPWRPRGHDEGNSGWGLNRSQSWDRRRDESHYSRREKEWAERR